MEEDATNPQNEEHNEVEEQSQDGQGETAGSLDFSSNLKLMRAPRFVPNYVSDSQICNCRGGSRGYTSTGARRTTSGEGGGR
jgi:hypothetical protein